MKFPLSILDVKTFLPHAYPFLLIDRILEIQLGKIKDSVKSVSSDAPVGTLVRGLKNVSVNEPFFQGHFPGNPIMPGVLILEAMAQTASFSLYPSFLEKKKTLAAEFHCILVGLDEVRFRKPVLPGDTLLIHIEVKKRRNTFWVFQGQAYVENKTVAEAQFLAELRFKENELDTFNSNY